MKIIIATDHNGVKEKKQIIEILKKINNVEEIIDKSPNNNPTDDYPEYAFSVSEEVSKDTESFGILLCGTGIGMCIAANKVKGIRCAHVSNLSEAKLARMHNNANVIAMSYRNNIKAIIECISAFITTNFADEERHIRRIKMINNYEREN